MLQLIADKTQTLKEFTENTLISDKYCDMLNVYLKNILSQNFRKIKAFFQFTLDKMIKMRYN